MTDRGHRSNYRYVSRKRRTKEDGRFIAGKGRFAADIAVPGMKHVAPVASPHPRAHHPFHRRRAPRSPIPACMRC